VKNLFITFNDKNFHVFTLGKKLHDAIQLCLEKQVVKIPRNSAGTCFFESCDLGVLRD